MPAIRSVNSKTIFADGFWLFGQAGVDIFFVISGFIMWVTTHDRPTTPLRFMTNRIVRIVPLYWLITLAVAAMAFAVPSLFRGVVLTPEHVIKSLLFIPHYYPGMPTRVWPLLLPGWTLNYEMVFYLVFAIALLLPRRLMIPLIAASLHGGGRIRLHLRFRQRRGGLSHRVDHPGIRHRNDARAPLASGKAADIASCRHFAA